MADPMAMKFSRELAFEYGRLEPVAPGIRRIMARNPSPFTLYGTGTYVIGEGEVAVLDPGPDDAAHVEALLEGLSGETVKHILVTHTHIDHSPAAAPLARRTGAPILGCAPHRVHDDRFTGEAGGDLQYRPDRTLEDGEVVSGGPWALEAIATPGHTSNHLCYALRGTDVLFSGDHVMGWSTTVVSPPDGDMRAYLHSLERLMARPEQTFWATHGPAIRGARGYLTALHAHRMEREALVLAALREGLNGIPAIVERIYTGLDPRLVRPAQRTTWAHLLKLIADGRAQARPAATLDGIYRPAE